MKDVIIKVLEDGLKYDDLKVEGSDAKYEVKIVSDEFKGKTIIQRHKMIYTLLDAYIKTGEIHALTIKAHTVSESK
jgi:acid stress-induced BolA-like protein IbaG/YrbA